MIKYLQHFFIFSFCSDQKTSQICAEIEEQGGEVISLNREENGSNIMAYLKN
jgi:hypothetical protein